MKIVFLENVLSFGGARKSTIELAQRFNKQYDVEVIDINGCCIPFVEACESSSLKLWIVDKRIKTFILSSSSLLHKLMNIILFGIYSLKINKKIYRRLSGEEKKVVIVNNSRVLSFLFFKPKNVEIILFARGWFLPQQISSMDMLLYKRLVDKYICVSEATRYAVHSAKLASLDNITVVHNAINVNKLLVSENIEKENNELKLLFSGGFLPTKGQLVALEIAKRLKQEGYKFKIILTGIIYAESTQSKKFYKYIKDLIIKYELNNEVEIVVGKNNILDYFVWCDMFIHPSDTEGLPRVIMEAMALKRPVIANAVGGITDYVLDGYTGFLTRHNNVEDYVDCIKRLYDDKSLYHKIVDNAYSLVTTSFTEDRQLSQMKKSLNLP